MADKTETTNETPDHSEGVNILVHDPVWSENNFQLINDESQVGNCMVQIDGQRRVSCSGHFQSASTHFKVFQGTTIGENEHLMMFESIGGESRGYMLCVDKEGLLSCQEKTREHYINIQDAEPEVLFIRERRSGEESGWFALRTLSGGYVGFDKRGKAKDPASVNPNQPEGQFVMNPI